MNIFLIALTCLLLIFTLLSVIKNQYWVFRVFDYPRLQKLLVSVICILLVPEFYDGEAIVKWGMTAILAANIIFLSTQVLPFTPLGKKQVLKAVTDKPEDSVCVMIANVYQHNRNFAGCLSVIKKHNPEVLLLLETDARWDQETSVLSQTYPYSIKVPLENTYGMLFYSKLPLQDAVVNYLVEKDIPSINTKMVLKSGRKVELFGVHPTPPVPNENPRSTERDKELLIVADMAKASALPVIVVGDLNDVAWSYTTELFLKMSGLTDPRRGRGFYNSFHAHYPLLRFPLDHTFISTDFKLKGMKRLGNFNSDHFPIYIHLQYEPQTGNDDLLLKPDADDLEMAAEKKWAV